MNSLANSLGFKYSASKDTPQKLDFILPKLSRRGLINLKLRMLAIP